jgi:hypothetical protein
MSGMGWRPKKAKKSLILQSGFEGVRETGFLEGPEETTGRGVPAARQTPE